MNLKDIDKLFNEHQHQFDKMPSNKLWERLEEKLDATPSMWEEKPRPKKVHWLRYVAAAAVILVMMVPAIYFTNAPQGDLAMEQPANYNESPAENNPSVRSADMESMKMKSDTAMSISKENNSPNTEIAANEERKEEETLIAAKSRDNNKDKPKFTSKNNTTIASNSNQTIDKPTIVTAAPKPSISTTNRSLKAISPNTSESSMTEDADIAIEEEVMEMEADDAGQVLDEVNINAYSAAKPVSKAAKPTVKATFNITDTNEAYAYSRYNADFNRSSLSNMMPYDGYGDERRSQSTLEMESAKKIESTKAGSSKKSKENSNNNIMLKRSASKTDMDGASSAKSLGFLSSLEGNWSFYLNGMFFEENWKMTPNGTLLGTAKTLQNGAILFAEDLSIHSLQGDKMTYTINHPNNSQSLTYQLRTSETSTDNENYFIFDNLQNDFPRTITYRLMNIDMLKITFEGQKDGKPIFKELILNRL
ncbi:MAG: DUF6265 family protein [Chitinophagales bacterium]